MVEKPPLTDPDAVPKLKRWKKRLEKEHKNYVAINQVFYSTTIAQRVKIYKLVELGISPAKAREIIVNNPHKEPPYSPKFLLNHIERLYRVRRRLGEALRRQNLPDETMVINGIKLVKCHSKSILRVYINGYDGRQFAGQRFTYLPEEKVWEKQLSERSVIQATLTLQKLKP